ncbi:MAG: hypothetical protein KDD78_00475 [Caldilineaceae bacterium]|nr:hypothetical protein [Caldilineaceae bacterium]
MRKRILILMSNTGGGHRASAQALQAGFARHAGAAVEVEIIDLLADHLPSPYRSLPRTYPLLVQRTPRLWRTLWQVTQHPQTDTTLAPAVSRLLYGALQRTFTAFQPDLVLSVHPLVQHISLYALQRSGLTCPFVTVVTDLVSPHTSWFHPAVTHCFVAGQDAYQRGLACGVPAPKLTCTGLPIRPGFDPVAGEKPALRRQLGLDPARPMALLLGGGDGVGQVARNAIAIAQRLAARRPAGPHRPTSEHTAQLVVICGHNQMVRTRLERRQWPLPVTVLGYVEEIHKWMRAADCLITKAGPGTIAEGLASGLPLLLSGYIPGQEEGNVRFVVENGAGRYATDAGQIAQIVEQWLGPDNPERAHMAANARRLASPAATDAIVTRVLSLLP